MIQNIVPASSATASEFLPTLKKLSLQPAPGGGVNHYAPKQRGNQYEQEGH